MGKGQRQGCLVADQIKTPRSRSPTFSLVSQEIVDLGCCSVVGTDNESLVIHVKDQVLTLQDASCRRRAVSIFRSPMWDREFVPGLP